MKKVKIVMASLAVLITLPIWFYLLYKILVAVNATELMWFLYWIYLPFAIFVTILQRIADTKE